MKTRPFGKLTIFITAIALMIATPAFAQQYVPDIIVTSSSGIWTDSRAYASLNAAITAVGANTRIVVISEPEVVTALTIPANVTLQFLRDGAIANSGQLTIQTTKIFAGNHQIFTGTGDIDFPAGSEVRSAWFSDLVEALDVTSDDTLTLMITEADNIDANAAVGANVQLKWDSPGNIITADLGFTMSAITNVVAGNYQIFAGDGDFDFSNGVKLDLDWFSNLRAANTWIESELVTLIVSGSHTAAYSSTVTTNTVLDFEDSNGQLTIGAGVDLTITNPTSVIAAANKEIFLGTGAVSFTEEGLVPIKWFTTSARAIDAVAEGSVLIIKGEFDVDTYGVIDSTKTISILGYGYTKDNSHNVYGDKIVNTTPIDDECINIHPALRTSGTFIKGIGIEHEGGTTFAIAIDNVIRTHIEDIDIELNDNGYGGISYTTAAFFAVNRNVRIRGFTDYGISITGTGSEYIIENPHISSSDVSSTLYGIYTTAPGTKIFDGEVACNAANGIGVYFYNTAGSVVNGGVVDGILIENMDTAEAAIKIDGATDAFSQVHLYNIRAALDEAAVVVSFQRATYCELINPVISTIGGGGDIAAFGANSVNCIISGDYSAGIADLTVNVAATRAQRLIHGHFVYDTHHATIDAQTDSNLLTMVEYYEEFNRGATHNGTAWDIGKFSLADDIATSVTTPGDYQMVEVVMLADGDGCAIIYADTGASSEVEGLALCTHTEVTTGVLNNGDGNDNKLTLSPHTDSKLYFSNRRGATRAFVYSFRHMEN